MDELLEAEANLSQIERLATLTAALLADADRETLIALELIGRKAKRIRLQISATVAAAAA